MPGARGPEEEQVLGSEGSCMDLSQSAVTARASGSPTCPLSLSSFPLVLAGGRLPLETGGQGARGSPFWAEEGGG